MRIAVFNDTSVTGHFGCTAVMAALLSGLTSRGARVPYRWPVATDWHPHADDLATRDIDALVVNGEGSIHHSADRPRSRQLCALGPFARDKLGVPSYLLNATMEALQPQALDDLRAFTAISVRETRTRDYLADHGIDAIVTGDLSLGTAAPDPGPRSGILVTDSVMRSTRKQLQRAARHSGARFERMKHRPGSVIRLRKRWRPDPLPLTDPLPDSLINGLNAFLKRMARHDLLVTGRFHSVCLALLTGTPLFALGSNTAKIPAILTDAMGHDRRVITSDDLSDFAALQGRASYTAAELQRINDYVTDCRRAQAAMFDKILAA